jgi:hypothetical protein
MRCQETHCAPCKVMCQTPVCTVQCPKTLCEKSSCPKCKTVCQPPQCKTVCDHPKPVCAPVCRKTQCEWICAKPAFCPKPKCELECERPKCSGPVCPCQCDNTANVLMAIHRANLGLKGYQGVYVETVPNKDREPLPSFVEVMSSMLHKHRSGGKTCCPCGDFDSLPPLAP